MKKYLSLILISAICSSLSVIVPNAASAAKIGTACKKVNLKSLDGRNPIICKKNNAGKLVWIRDSKVTSSQKTFRLQIVLTEFNETGLSSNDQSAWYCDGGGLNYQDISASTKVEIRDGAGNLLATGKLGSATVVDENEEDAAPGSAEAIRSACVFNPVLVLKKSEFYQVKIGSRYENSFSFSDLVNDKWKILLSIGL